MYYTLAMRMCRMFITQTLWLPCLFNYNICPVILCISMCNVLDDCSDESRVKYYKTRQMAVEIHKCRMPRSSINLLTANFKLSLF